MERNTIKAIIVGSVVCIFSMVSTVFAFTNFSDNVSSSNKSKEWMKEISDHKYLSEINIPGSHDSGALYSIADLAGKCQDAAIISQLEYGVRFLDMRLELRNGNFSVTHGFVDQRLSFDTVMNSVESFLKDHPSETILMSIKNEAGKDEKEFASIFEEAVKNDLTYWYYESSLPKLGQVRGKIVLLSRYKFHTIGINLYEEWQDNTTFDILAEGYTFHIQDQYDLSDTDTKKGVVESCLAYSRDNLNPTTYTINYLSGVLDHGFPPSYSVPVAKELNNYFKSSTSSYSKVGTVMFDFVSEELASLVYERNFNS